MALHALGDLHKPEATLFGVTGTLLTELQADTAAYFEAIPKPRLSISDKKELNMELKNLQKKCDNNLDVIDALVDAAEEDQPVFWQGYYNVRKIVDFGRRHLAAKIQVNEAGAGIGLKSVELEITEQNGGVKAGTDMTKTVKRTSEMGGCWIKGIAQGTYLIKASKEGYAAQTVTMYVNEGELTKVGIELVKI